MKVYFYSPIAKPDASSPSGVARVGDLYVRALQLGGFEVNVPSLPRVYDGGGDEAVQMRQAGEAMSAADALLARIREGSVPRPDAWFSYHVYYKSPDHVGPRVSSALGIPYLVAEGSHAPKRSGGPWRVGHDATCVALSQASLLFAVTAFDRVCLDQIAPGRVRDLKPFIDASPFAAIGRRDAGVPLRLLAIGMMRNERKLESYRQLAAALALLHDVSLQVTIIGDGTFRSDVERVFAEPAQRHRIQFVGAVAPSDIPGFMAQADAFAWPGIGEAYGIVFLEAQAAGLPVIACRDRGVPDAVEENHSALLSEPGDALALARNLRVVAEDASLRTRLGQRGRAFVMQDRSLEAAARGLGSAIRSIAS